MDDISRGSLPDSPGQRESEGGHRRKGPAEWTDVAEGELDGGDRFSPDLRVSVPGSEGIVLAAPTVDSASGQSGETDPVNPMEADPPEDAPNPEDAPEEEAKAELTPAALARVLCALLLSSREAVSLLRLAQAAGTTTKAIRAGLDVLQETLADGNLPLEVNIAGDQVRLLTTPDVFDQLRELRAVKKQEKLSAAALETLAVVAYRQPVMRAEIEAIRGVKAGPILRTLLDHRMIKTVGRADVPGRPLQYGTTQHFLETFGLETLADLPSVKEFRGL